MQCWLVLVFAMLSTHHILLPMWLEADKLAVTYKDKEKKPEEETKLHTYLRSDILKKKSPDNNVDYCLKSTLCFYVRII
jgi:uncharacterized hydantoinase/oxoprolinase family protein